VVKGAAALPTSEAMPAALPTSEAVPVHPRLERYRVLEKKAQAEDDALGLKLPVIVPDYIVILSGSLGFDYRWWLFVILSW
jgi:hypothetical protein